MKKTALIIGKFVPLHKGHQLLIEKALAEMDCVVVAVFDNPRFSIPISRRVKWLKSLYPKLEIIVIKDISTESFANPIVWDRHEKLLLENIDKNKITHIYSGERYGKRLAKTFGAINVLVDKNRKTAPVSGSAIMKGPHKFQDYLEPMVYNYLIGSFNARKKRKRREKAG